MRISDWSSDVCSSDLRRRGRRVHPHRRCDRWLVEGDTLMPLTNDDDIRALLASTRTIAMIGASDRPERDSNHVMAFLQQHGYRVLPVNPQITGEHVHGEFVWRELSQIGEPIDLADIFRSAERRVGKACGVTGIFRWSPNH